MKRLIIICEGPTELQFCQEVLYDHFFALNILIQCPLPKWSHGGHIYWPPLEKQIRATLLNESDAFVTTFIDLYGLHKPEVFPGWDDALKLTGDPYSRVTSLENAMREALSEELRRRFVPNIILFEFEGLLFNDVKHFDDYFEEQEYKDRNELLKVLELFPNPELINENKSTSPSHRLDGVIFHSFKKTLDGIDLAKRIGLIEMRKKCAHFNEWITCLESV